MSGKMVVQSKPHSATSLLMSRSEPQLPGTVSCVVDNVAQSGHDAGLATVQKTKSHQVETGIVVRISARNARCNA